MSTLITTAGSNLRTS